MRVASSFLAGGGWFRFWKQKRGLRLGVGATASSCTLGFVEHQVPWSQFEVFSRRAEVEKMQFMCIGGRFSRWTLFGSQGRVLLCASPRSNEQ